MLKTNKWVTANDVRDGLKKGSRLLMVTKQDNADEVKIRLNELGYSVTLVSRAFEALQALQSKTFDMVLVDLSTDAEESYATSEMIRIIEEPGQKPTPIIALTAESLEVVEQKALQAGVTQVVAKTEDLDALQNALMTLSSQLR